MNNLTDVCDHTLKSKPKPHWVRKVLRGICNGLERARTRRLLGQLDDRQLSDLGISHSDRVNEVDKPFWRE